MDYHAFQEKDTTFIDLSKSQIKNLHDEIFGSTIINEGAFTTIVKLELTYIPFLLFIVIMVTAINIRWNKAYTRLEKVAEKADEERNSSDFKEKVSKLKVQRINIYDRFFVYLIIWFSSLYIDGMLMFFGVFDFPWLSIPVIITVITKKLKKLISTNTLLGFDDEDIISNFDSILKDMILKPIIESITSKIKTKFNN